jgi:hypothetical protein
MTQNIGAVTGLSAVRARPTKQDDWENNPHPAHVQPLQFRYGKNFSLSLFGYTSRTSTGLYS